jgi:hypothetical protein
LPNEVTFSIYRTYPDYTVNDKYLYTQEEDILKKQYNLKIKRKANAQTDRSSKGDIVKSDKTQSKKKKVKVSLASSLTCLN